jgi:predicted HicB family RNase H-like nuclease
MGKDIVTSFRVNEELWREARIYALKNDMSIKDLIEELIRRELKEQTLLKKQAKEAHA